ncbi:MAG: hypothetical protein FWF56_06535 [Firmicutes bacterium]|nr:hypothetical protein [Bacillota bacterium]MCL1953651.1 hypothetical protein [Bacillota bacterium]
MMQLILVSIVAIISLFYNTVFVHIKTRKRLKSVTEQTKFREYWDIFIIGLIANIVLLILSLSIALGYGVEWEWFGGTAMLSVFPTLVISPIPIILVRKPMFKYKIKKSFLEIILRSHRDYKDRYINYRLDTEILFSIFF